MLSFKLFIYAHPITDFSFTLTMSMLHKKRLYGTGLRKTKPQTDYLGKNKIFFVTSSTSMYARVAAGREVTSLLQVQVSDDTGLHSSDTDYMERRDGFEMQSWGGRGKFADTIRWRRIKEKKESKMIGFSPLTWAIRLLAKTRSL